MNEFVQQAQERIQVEKQMRVKQAEMRKRIIPKVGDKGRRRGNGKGRRKARHNPLRPQRVEQDTEEIPATSLPHMSRFDHRYEKYTLLSTLIYQVLMAVHDMPLIRRLPPL